MWRTLSKMSQGADVSRLTHKIVASFWIDSVYGTWTKSLTSESGLHRSADPEYGLIRITGSPRLGAALPSLEVCALPSAASFEFQHQPLHIHHRRRRQIQNLQSSGSVADSRASYADFCVYRKHHAFVIRLTDPSRRHCWKSRND